jgi:hypothetical protein
MKYILFGEMPPARGEPDTTPEERKEAQELRKNEEKYGKVILEPHWYATGKAVVVVEFDNPQQMANRLALGIKDHIYTIYPLIPREEWRNAMNEHHWNKRD